MDKLYIYRILNAYFNNKQPEPYLNEDADKLIALTREQALSPLLYLLFKEQVFKKDYILATINQERFITLQKEVTSILKENKIPHMYFKGSVVYKLYKDTALRTRGDIDLIVPKDMYIRAKNCLIDAGFIQEHVAVEHHFELLKDGYLVELHQTFFDEEDEIDYNIEIDFGKYDEDYVVEFDPTKHLIYIILHYVKHIKSLGAGIRPLLDIGLILKNYRIDNKYLEKELLKLELNTFYNVLLNACNYIFDDIKPKKKIDVTNFLEYLVVSGIHGFSIMNEDLDERVVLKKGGSKIGYIFSKVFPKPKALRLMYPNCDKHPILLPFYWFKNLFRLMFKKSHRIKEIMQVDNTKINQINNFYKSIGLKR